VKKKDIMALMLAVVIFLAAGYIGFTQILGKKKGSSSAGGVQVEVIGSIPASFDSGALSDLNDPTKVKDFSVPVDFSGLNNTAPFGH
jgi:hypothetical protein